MTPDPHRERRVKAAMQALVNDFEVIFGDDDMPALMDYERAAGLALDAAEQASPTVPREKYEELARVAEELAEALKSVLESVIPESQRLDAWLVLNRYRAAQGAEEPTERSGS